MKIETRGLDSVPGPERKASGADLFVIWAGVSFCLPSFITGALLVPAFSWADAVEINFLGNLLVGVLIVLGGYYGTRTGYPAVVYGRHVFGYPLGHWIPTFALLASTLGWYAVMTAMTGAFINDVIKTATGFSSPVLVVILVGLLNASTAVLGYQKIRRLSWITVPLLSIICLWMIYKIMSTAAMPELLGYRPGGGLSYAGGVDLIIGGFLAGAFAASDFSRYARSNRDNWIGTMAGAFLVSFLLGLIGMLSVAATGDWNPLSAVMALGMGIPALIFVVLANWTTNDNLLYSSGLALTNIMPGLTRWKNTLLCGVAGTVMAAAGITDYLQSWLMLLAYVFSPLLGVVLTDFFIITGKKTAAPLNIQAVAALAAGIVIAAATPQQYMASLAGLAGGAAAYILLLVITGQAVLRRAVHKKQPAAKSRV